MVSYQMKQPIITLEEEKSSKGDKSPEPVPVTDRSKGREGEIPRGPEFRDRNRNRGEKLRTGYPFRVGETG
jgi:hypothetical protein